ncbi:MAG: hypothetical protein HWN81_17010 [Candidatus Lokiarchaeota archaeon]|nr:hypothetical protein [Candidatus Lokiarchaeota archaeon]
MSENTLKARINVLEAELIKKDNEIHNLLDRIEEHEDTIMRLEALIPDEDNKKKSKKEKATDSKLAIELDEKDRQIRELKNNMGFLRKEKVQLQQKLERIKSRSNESSVIRVEDLRSKPPLNALVKDLQEKINKQQSLLSKLRANKVGNEDFDEKLKEKEEEIENLKLEILELNQKIKDFSIASDDKKGDSITKKLIEDLQQQLNKSKRQVTELKQKLEKSVKASKKELKEITNDGDLKRQINELNELLKSKDKEIEGLNNNVISLQKAEIVTNFEQNDVSSDQMIKTLKEDLQNKLNRAKLQIKSLQEQVRKAQLVKTPELSGNQNELEGKLKMQREMAIFLQKQLDAKEGEIETIKNEAVQIKTKYRQLENQVRLKDQKISDLQRQLDSITIQTQIQPKKEDPNLALRLRELKNKMEYLEKLNSEQKLEISQLRKKI